MLFIYYDILNNTCHSKKFIKSIQNANADLESLNQALASVDDLGNKLAQHFCEDETKFKIEECLGIYKTFCDNINKCEKVSKISAKRLQCNF